MMKRTTLAGLFLLLLTLAGCQSSNVTIDYDTQTNFQGLQRYHWLTQDTKVSPAGEGDQPSQQQQQDPLLAERARSAISQHMPLALSDSPKTADVLVSYQIKSATETKEPKTRGGIGIGSRGGNTSVGISLSLPLGSNQPVKKVQLIIDFLDPGSQQLLWRGANMISITKESPEVITNKVNSAVREILSQYPPS